VIPKILHFVWIGDDSKRPDNFLASWAERNPGWTIKVWSNEDLVSRQWKNRRRMAELGRVDARLVAELMRWEILFDEGGLAFDIDSACVRPLEDFLCECEMFACWENELTEPGLVCSKFVGACAGNPFVGSLIGSIQAESGPPLIATRQSADSRRLTRLWRDLKYRGLTVFPSHYFNPRPLVGAPYQGGGRVFAIHEWASSLGRVESLHQANIESQWNGESAPSAGASRPAPRFSIVIPTYNRADTLPAAVESALGQTCQDLEVVVVDDGSTDSSAEWLARQTDARVRHVRQANGGEAAARNRGISEACGDYIVWLDSDDLLLPDALASYSRRIDTGTVADIMYGHLVVINKEGRETSRIRYDDLSAGPVFPALFMRNRLPNPGTAVRRGLFNSVGLYDVALESSPDYDMWIRAAANGARFACVNEFVCRYRWFGGNISADTNKIRRADAQIARKCVQNIPMPILLPHLNWANPQLALTQASLLAAMVFAERGDFQSCAGLAEHAGARAREMSSQPAPEPGRAPKEADRAMAA